MRRLLLGSSNRPAAGKENVDSNSIVRTRSSMPFVVAEMHVDEEHGQQKQKSKFALQRMWPLSRPRRNQSKQLLVESLSSNGAEEIESSHGNASDTELMEDTTRNSREQNASGIDVETTWDDAALLEVGSMGSSDDSPNVSDKIEPVAEESHKPTTVAEHSFKTRVARKSIESKASTHKQPRSSNTALRTPRASLQRTRPALSSRRMKNLSKQSSRTEGAEKIKSKPASRMARSTSAITSREGSTVSSLENPTLPMGNSKKESQGQSAVGIDVGQAFEHATSANSESMSDVSSSGHDKLLETIAEESVTSKAIAKKSSSSKTKRVRGTLGMRKLPLVVSTQPRKMSRRRNNEVRQSTDLDLDVATHHGALGSLGLANWKANHATEDNALYSARTNAGEKKALVAALNSRLDCLLRHLENGGDEIQGSSRENALKSVKDAMACKRGHRLHEMQSKVSELDAQIEKIMAQQRIVEG